MSIGLVFWVLMLFWIVSRVFWYRSNWTPGTGMYPFIGSDLFIFILLFLLGWHSFGFIIRYS